MRTSSENEFFLRIQIAWFLFLSSLLSSFQLFLSISLSSYSLFRSILSLSLSLQLKFSPKYHNPIGESFSLPSPSLFSLLSLSLSFFPFFHSLSPSFPPSLSPHHSFSSSIHSLLYSEPPRDKAVTTRRRRYRLVHYFVREREKKIMGRRSV